jgi:hypothetical protein
LGGAAFAVPVGVAWLDLTSFEQYGVATSSASPSQSKDSGTSYGAPSAEALATQTSLSWVS